MDVAVNITTMTVYHRVTFTKDDVLYTSYCYTSTKKSYKHFSHIKLLEVW